MQGLSHDHPHGFEPQPTPPRKSWPRPQPRAKRPRRDPAPSRLAYRLQRVWLTPSFRRMTRIGLPLFFVLLIAALWLSDADSRAKIAGAVTGVVEQIQNRDQFMVKTMQIDGASAPVAKALRMMLPVDLPASSFDIDLDDLRRDIRELAAVEDVDLRIKPGGLLVAQVTEREPALLWRHESGIELLDRGGYRTGSVTARSVRPELPLIAGEGADRATAEALDLLSVAGPILPRIRGLQRLGERRWDVVLDRGQRIMLPQDGAIAALERAIALIEADDLLARDISVLDLRNGARPVVRMGLNAQNTLRAARGQPLLGADGRELPQEKG